MLQSQFIIPFTCALIFCSALTPAVIKLARLLNIQDAPAVSRKIHSYPVPLMGGLAIYLAYVLALWLSFKLGYFEGTKIIWPHVTAMLIGGGVLMLGGVLDDKFNLKPIQQIFFPVIAVLIVIFSGLSIEYLTNPTGGIIDLAQTPLLSLGLTFIWLLAMTYTTKILDGLDGLVGGITVIAAMIIFAVSLKWDSQPSATSVLTLILAGSALGFLIFNWHPAKIFLGEGGSVVTGFFIGVLSIISGAKIATTLLIMTIPIIDVAWVVYQRLKDRAHPLKTGDRRHLHFRLLNIGFTHRQSVVFLLVISALFGITGLFLNTVGKIAVLAILSLLTVLFLWFVLKKYEKKVR
ncbi:MAG: hypothetical protein COT81_02710 [Candidatus Buchananbacteria bacterium CG10_big_fil_rev_8_21_14_0_10_42_9]|uniref:Undecaprenyl-phosphate alpha-N-acetylglucosaminyl 1-phosphate transferase n=1 Tax=Candidatus Buchananbacteria bacterium CG10_big_fil_rev_8_21_14_0_10_42_9 TaxID=1974526 RepID=A0A2H0W1B1_9BACT|nr:MAG: hypothetical protein COT81_02710 [Candidatus Buchananbacteria bacterium CG10_big_fil_rev_8_21_14_0_10_42_9]